jgi:hypothetical protein
MDKSKDTIKNELAKVAEETKVEVEELDDLDLAKVAGGVASDELQEINGIKCTTTNESMCACNQNAAG